MNDQSSRTTAFGASPGDGHVDFGLWAPKLERVVLVIEGGDRIEMTGEDGWFSARAAIGPGTRYHFEDHQGQPFPDPASRYQPEDVHGPSEVIDGSAFRWTDADFRERPWHETIIYEMHVGTFTPEGTFAAAAARLDHLANLGVTAIEVMPVADFPGQRNWGYDGVLPYAPDASYGRPDDFKAFVDRAHELGLSVILDVVYNHFGPEGNYLPKLCPIFTDKHVTPWGAAVNYDDADSATIRRYVIDNAVHWIEEFHLDGLRLDAVHEIKDDSETHLLDDLATAIRSHFPDRDIHLILENEDNDPSRIAPDAPFTAQWNDDLHHALHVAVTGEDEGYYADYAGQPALLARALAEGFAFQGEHMPYRGRPRGAPARHLPPTAFVSFLQNHDQIGNRALGDRIHATSAPEAVRAATAVCLLSPQIPLVFQGEEWAATTPFPFFCDFGGDLADVVREGRRSEFARFPSYSDPARRETIPDPNALGTFQSAKLDWSECERAEHRETLAWFCRLIAARKADVIPLLPGLTGAGQAETAGTLVSVIWEGPLGALGAVLQLSAGTIPIPHGGMAESLLRPAPEATGTHSWRCFWQEGTAEDGVVGPWFAAFFTSPPA